MLVMLTQGMVPIQSDYTLWFLAHQMRNHKNLMLMKYMLNYKYFKYYMLITLA